MLNVAYELVLADVKTKTSRRTIDLDPRTVAVLRAWRKTQLEERLALGHRPDDNGIVFAKPDGTPIHPDFFSQIFDRHVAKSTLPRIRLHDLRHTHATILLKAGVPVKVVSERLGHASPGLHDDRLPTRPPRHAGRRRPEAIRRCSQLKSEPDLGHAGARSRVPPISRTTAWARWNWSILIVSSSRSVGTSTPSSSPTSGAATRRRRYELVTVRPSHTGSSSSSSCCCPHSSER